jgi:UDP-glucose 4-epimerase
MTLGATSNGFWAGRRCVITGAAGFIGVALTHRLRSMSADVRAYSRSECDVTDIARVRAIFQSDQPEVVFHLAGKVTGSRALEMVPATLTTNLLGTVHVLQTAAEMKLAARIVCLGSLHEPDQVLPPVPPTPYAAAKFAANAYARMFAEIYSLSTIIARPLMVYGPGQMDFSKLVPYVLERLLTGRPAELSSGRQGFDWVYVDDVVEALLAAAERTDLIGETLDVGTGVLTTVADVATGIARRLQAAPSDLLLGALPDRGLEPTRAADVEATARLTGWRARVGIEAGLDHTVQWYQRYFDQSHARKGAENGR